MRIGFIGLGNIGLPMAHRLLEGGHELMVFDIAADPVAQLAAHGAQAVSSPREVADEVETVLLSLPTPAVSVEVTTGRDGVAEGRTVRRVVDLSTIGSPTAQSISRVLGQRGIAYIDSPVSGGVVGARNGTLALMVSGPAADVDAVAPVLAMLGTAFRLGENAGAGQTMKLINNMLAATALAATAEAVVMGVKAGLDPTVMIDTLNAGSGANTATRDKFPRAVLPRTFDYGFATGLMAKDVGLFLDEAHALGMSTDVADAVGRIWQHTLDTMGAQSDFTSVIQPIERAAGVVVGEPPREPDTRAVP